eukprot:4718328-Pyramimonas_sp.AAC.1
MNLARRVCLTSALWSLQRVAPLHKSGPRVCTRSTVCALSLYPVTGLAFRTPFLAQRHYPQAGRRRRGGEAGWCWEPSLARAGPRHPGTATRVAEPSNLVGVDGPALGFRR